MKTYSIGEIHRLGLLKSHTGEPYKDKATVSRVVSTMSFIEKNTPWGMAKTLTEADIQRHNDKFKD